MNSNLTDNEWVKRVSEIRQMVSDVPEVPEDVSDIGFYVAEFGLTDDDEIKFAYEEFVRQYWHKPQES